jgi:hypothetical protein
MQLSMQVFLEVIFVVSSNDDVVYLQHHPTKLRGQQQLLALADEWINYEMLSHICLIVSGSQKLEFLD